MGVTYNQGPVVPAQAKFNGTDTLGQGYALCHDTTLTDGTQEFTVAKPATANLNNFFGLVSADSDGKQGPNLVEVLRPGSVGLAWVQATCVAGVTKLKVINGQYYLTAATASSASVIATPTNSVVGDDFVAVALQTIDTSGAAALVLVQIRQGKA